MQNHPQEPAPGSAGGLGYAGGPAPVRAAGPRATAAPIRWKISRACPMLSACFSGWAAAAQLPISCWTAPSWH